MIRTPEAGVVDERIVQQLANLAREEHQRQKSKDGQHSVINNESSVSSELIDPSQHKETVLFVLVDDLNNLTDIAARIE